MKKFSKRDLKRQINGDLPLEAKNQKNINKANPEKRRLDELVFEKYPEYSHNSLRIAIRDGLVSVENATKNENASKNENAPETTSAPKSVPKPETDPAALLPKESIVTLNLPEKPTPPPPDVIYEDANVLVINKPAGLLSIVKGNFCFEPSAADYGQIVHRLDRATSGVMILAKNRATKKLLQCQFNQRTAHKTYYAIVSGVPQVPKAKIDLPIARDLNHPTTFKIDLGGRPAQTYYEVVATKNNRSLIKLQPITGRTHQLRLHLKYLGCPIVGDPVYGDAKSPIGKSPAHGDKEPQNADAKQAQYPRLLLHATFLEITIPGQNADAPNERKTFFAPLPPEFTADFPYEPDPSRIAQSKTEKFAADDPSRGASH